MNKPNRTSQVSNQELDVLEIIEYGETVDSFSVDDAQAQIEY